jgi:hypothetical protein
MIVKRVPRKTLDERWTSLTPSQRSEIAEKIAKYCLKLSNITSSRFESASKHGVMNYFLADKIPSGHPTWKPLLIGPFSHGHFTKFLTARTGKSTEPIPSFGKTFQFYHPDLGPTKIMISEEGSITGILDWESAFFCPRFWIALQVVISAGFLLNEDYVGEGLTRRCVWAELLNEALITEGFEYSKDHVRWYKSLVR